MVNIVEQGTSTLTRKGQVTVPANIRRYLGLAPRDKVAFVIRDGHVEIAPTESVVARTAGILRSRGPAISTREEKESAEQAMAEEADPKHS
jgi:antitoxin PrlF